jgi:hypothetical protein
MNMRTTFTLITFAAVFAGSSATAEARLPFPPSVDWPFGEYRTCLGYAGKRTFKRPLTEYSVERLASVGQGADKQYVVGNWSDPILSEQIIAAHEFTIEQCRLRKLGKSFSKDCPLGNLSRDEAVEIVGADNDEYWSNPSSNLQALKKAQQDRLEALRPVIEEACGP